MKAFKIAAVEYMNTLPFLHGISEHINPKLFSIIAANPARCATLFRDQEADIALVPVGALHLIGQHQIITDFCIGSDGPVDTVALLSNTPVDQIKKISLDAHSRTSANLIKILCQKYWKINPVYTAMTTKFDEESLLLIGDKVKDQEHNFTYKYDLGAVWQILTKLPMVFAVWVARDYVDDEMVSKLNQAFGLAIQNLSAVPLADYPNEAYWQHYINHSINYHLNDTAREGMSQFLKMCKELNL